MSVRKVWVPLDRISLKPRQYVTADKPETTAAFPVNQEIIVESNPNSTWTQILLLTKAKRFLVVQILNKHNMYKLELTSINLMVQSILSI